MAILVKTDILGLKDKIFKNGTFEPKCLRGANYDLRLGEEVFISTEKVPRKLSKVEDGIAIRPGEFALLTTYEIVSIPPNLMGFISLRFTYAVRGLVNISGRHVDPGWEGRIVFSVYNAGPNDIVLRYEDPIFMIIFEELKGETDAYPSWGKFSPQLKIPVEWITGLRGIPVSIKDLDTRVRTHNTEIRIMGGILVSLIVGFILMVLPRIFG